MKCQERHINVHVLPASSELIARVCGTHTTCCTFEAVLVYKLCYISSHHHVKAFKVYVMFTETMVRVIIVGITVHDETMPY